MKYRTPKSTSLTVTCPNEECERELEVEVTHPTPATGRWGPPENYDPGDGGDIFPAHCPHCGTELDADRIFEEAGVRAYDDHVAAAEARWDAQREDQMLNRE